MTSKPYKPPKGYLKALKQLYKPYVRLKTHLIARDGDSLTLCGRQRSKVKSETIPQEDGYLSRTSILEFWKNLGYVCKTCKKQVQ